MLTREQIEEIHTERREMGIPTKHTLRRQHFYFFAIHLTQQSPFCGPPRHIGSRDGFQEARRTETYLPLTAKYGHVLTHTLHLNILISVGAFVDI